MTRVSGPTTQLPRLFSMFFSMLRWCSANQPAQSPPNPPPTASLNPIRPRKPCESRLRIGCRHCCVCTINNSIGHLQSRWVGSKTVVARGAGV